MTVWRVALACTLVLVATSCAANEDVAPAPATTVAVLSATDPAPEPIDVSTLAGEPKDRFSFGEGECFNEYDELNIDGRQVEFTAVLPCDVPHDAEVYLKTEHPAPFGEPYPGEDEMVRYGTKQCYDGFAAFVGEVYELSELDIGVFVPPQENFEDSAARYRGITCFVRMSRDEQLAGSMRGTGR